MDSFHFFMLSLLPLYELLPSASAQLRQNYYSNICPNVESIVCAAVTQKFQQPFVTTPATLKLFFHDCFVRGCDASVLLASPNGSAEKDHPDDISLAGDGFNTVIKAKEAVDRDPSSQNKVSCADILAMATRDVVALAGGPFYAVKLGRCDGRISTKASVQCHLPQPSFHLDQLNAMFASHGLTQTDMIALSANLQEEFTSTALVDQLIQHSNPSYASQLRQICPLNVNPRISINMDPTTPQTFDNASFRNLQQGMGLFTSDQTLFTDARSRGMVNLFAANNTAFQVAFITAITKLGRVGVKTGSLGEIRCDRTAVN